MRAIILRRGAIVAALAVAASGLTACGGGGGSTIITPPPPPKLEDGFGSGFGALFRAAPNSEPGKPQASDIKAVDPTATPVALK
ncbi:hypothetical protein ACN2C6_04215 [Caulobacter sp. ErkDOM-YI]|uniref:hypothetical protein n=1 Tax=unclassified Caulobacter TaxID=2648921 RepID=UPI003AF9C343